MLIVLSLLTTAATVVYVNKEDVQKTTLATTQAQLQAAQAAAQAARDELTAAQQNLTNVQAAANQASQAATTDINARQQQNSQAAGRTRQGAEPAGDAAARRQPADRSAQRQPGQHRRADRQELARLRTNNDQLVRQASDLNGSVSDLTARLEVTERERRLLAEQLTQASTENQRLSMIIKNANMTPGPARRASPSAPGPPINGVIRDVRTIAGRPYATISVGTADGVQRGMEFKILDRAGRQLPRHAGGRFGRAERSDRPTRRPQGRRDPPGRRSRARSCERRVLTAQC